MKEKIIKLLNDNEFSEAASEASKLSVSEIVEIIEKLDATKLIGFCRELDSDFLADVLVELDKDLQAKIIDNLKEEQLDEVMEEVSPQDTAEIIEDIPQKMALKIIEEEEISVLFHDKKFAILKPLLASMNQIDLAEVFGNLPDEEIPLIFRLLSKDQAAATFVEMDSDVQAKLLEKLSNTELKNVMEEVFIDDMADLVEEMPSNVVKRILAQADKETRDYLNEILKYPKDSAGSIMTVEFVSLEASLTVEQAFKRIRKIAIDKETIYTCYVVEPDNRLIGLVTAKKLLLSSPEAIIKDIMEENVIYANTTDDKEDVARKLADYGFIAIPVVDDEKRLVGIVTVDDAISVLQEENTEDIAKMAAVTPSDKTYLKTGVFEIWRNRIPWLLVLMVSATFTGLILNTYEVRLNAISTVLFACVPMIMDTGGNAGSQASVTIIRSLALGEVETRDILKVIWKEIRAASLLAITLAIACFAKLMLIDNLLFGYTDYTPVRCLIVAAALFCTVVIAKMVGCSLPLIAKKCRLDPAVVASPFITTIVDALSLIIYCALAVALLS